MVNLGINGFGRTGRCAFRAALEAGMPVVAVNGTSDTATLAHLLKYDSTYGTLNEDVRAGPDSLFVGGNETRVSFERKPGNISWDGVDVVLECTGKFRERAAAEQHIAGGAAKVIIGAPATGEDVTIVLGVNEQAYDRERHCVISNASCTTNCLAPVVKVLNDSFGIEQGLMTTVHAYTGDQRLLDGTHRDVRRARSAGVSMIPTTTGAAKALGKVIPELDGRLNGFAIRVPTAAVSLVDLTVQLRNAASKEDINSAFRTASLNGLKNIFGVSEEPLVSVDFRGDPRSAVVDMLSTMVMGRSAKVVAWYDNEWAYATRLVELAAYVMK